MDFKIDKILMSTFFNICMIILVIKKFSISNPYD